MIASAVQNANGGAAKDVRPLGRDLRRFVRRAVRVAIPHLGRHLGRTKVGQIGESGAGNGSANILTIGVEREAIRTGTVAGGPRP